MNVIFNGSNVRLLEYPDNVQVGDLVITFKNGAKYRYKNVPLEKVNEMQKAASAGSYLLKNISNTYKYERI